MVTFMAREASSRSTKKVTVTRGNCYHYSDYGYGSYLTYQYTVKFGNVSATAYCIQPEKSVLEPEHTILQAGDGKKLAKVCYYGTKAAGDEGFFTRRRRLWQFKCRCQIYSGSSCCILCKWWRFRFFRSKQQSKNTCYETV